MRRLRRAGVALGVAGFAVGAPAAGVPDAAGAADAVEALRGGAVAATAEGPGDATRGRSLYLEGLRSEGGALVGRRSDGVEVRGGSAACVNCHRPSGMGGAEGSVAIPPIAGALLFAPGRVDAVRDPRHAASMVHERAAWQTRGAYDGDSLHAALRLGRAQGGGALGYLMPRYDVSAQDTRDLAAYLRTLGVGPGTVPGVDAGALHLATVVHESVPEGERRAMVDILQRCVAERSPRAVSAAAPLAGAAVGPQASRVVSESASGSAAGGAAAVAAGVAALPADASAASAMPAGVPGPVPVRRVGSPHPARLHADRMATRPWQLHTWTLRGAPETWAAQLDELARRQPVFALVSGLTGDAWAPVQRHCEASGTPCVLPNTVAVDPLAPGAWSLHLSLGVAAEAAALVEHLEAAHESGTRPRVHQVVGRGEAAQIGARTLRRLLQGQGWPQAEEDLPVDSAPAARLRGNLAADAVLVLWLDATALRTYSQAPPPQTGSVYLSGSLAGLEAAPLATAWRDRALMLYPYEPADRRQGRIVLNAGNWMARNGLSLAADTLLLQGQTYSACEMTARALQIMGPRYSRAYFMELLEGSAEGALATGFPRFTLGQNRRHGSRGAYVMRYDAAPASQGSAPAHLSRVSDWLLER